MADVHRILGQIPEGADVAVTVDGRPKTEAASRARLARLVGRDAAELEAAHWDALAEFFARAQLRRIEDQIALLASRESFAARAKIIGAGIGRGVLAAWAAREGREFEDFSGFVKAAPGLAGAAADCAPACCLALLASEP